MEVLFYVLHLHVRYKLVPCGKTAPLSNSKYCIAAVIANNASELCVCINFNCDN